MSAYSPPGSWTRKQLRAERVAVAMPAKIVTMNDYRFPELADISQSGVKVRGDSLPPKGTTVLLRVGALEVLCRVVRVSGDECGLRFEEPVPPRLIKQIHLEGAVELAPLLGD